MDAGNYAEGRERLEVGRHFLQLGKFLEDQMAYWQLPEVREVPKERVRCS